MIGKKLFAGMSAVVLALGMTTTGCVSYHGSYDVKTPVNERCLLELPEGIIVTRMDGKAVDWYGLITIPAGEHTVLVDYEINSGDMSAFGRSSEYISISASNIKVTSLFTAGHHYIVEPHFFREEGKNYVSIGITDKGTKTSRFNNGVYSGLEPFTGLYLGTNSISWVSFGGFYGYKYIHDGAAHYELSLDMGVDAGFFPLEVGAYGGGMATFFIPGTNFGLGAGGGITTTQYFTEFFPYARAEAVLPRTNNYLLWKIYFDYYFNQKMIDEMNKNSSQYASDPPEARRWGLGVKLQLF